jgi:hypothetical protein
MKAERLRLKAGLLLAPVSAFAYCFMPLAFCFKLFALSLSLALLIFLSSGTSIYHHITPIHLNTGRSCVLMQTILT